MPGSLRIISDYATWLERTEKDKYLPLLDENQYLKNPTRSLSLNFIKLDAYSKAYPHFNLDELCQQLKFDRHAIICLSTKNTNSVQSIRRMIMHLSEQEIQNPIILVSEGEHENKDDALIQYSIETGGLLLDGFGNGIMLLHQHENQQSLNPNLVNSISFGILQATRTRISKTEYISCPSCGRTLFDLQETTSRIRAVTNHLKGVKIAIMGCIVNGPGEMADADFGYVGSGPGKITLYKGKEVIKRSVPEEIAVDELIVLLKENNAWIEVNKN